MPTKQQAIPSWRPASLLAALPILITAFLLLVQPAVGQVITGDLVGTVADQTGAIIPGANVIATNAGTRSKRSTTTNENGEFTFALLQTGEYVLEISAPGFQRYTVSKITLNAGDRLRSDVQLKPGASTQTIEVTADSVGLQTDSATVA